MDNHAPVSPLCSILTVGSIHSPLSMESLPQWTNPSDACHWITKRPKISAALFSSNHQKQFDEKVTPRKHWEMWGTHWWRCLRSQRRVSASTDPLRWGNRTSKWNMLWSPHIEISNSSKQKVILCRCFQNFTSA